MLNPIALIVIIAGTAGCSGSDVASAPTAPSPLGSTPQVAPNQELALRLRGFITDTAYRPLAGAQIVVVDGASAGVSAISDAEGQFALSGRFSAATQFRASKEGHETRT